MKNIKLNSGYEIPILGLGTWKSGKGEVYRAIREAIKIGYRHFDCAHIYGNETEIGEALADAVAVGDVNRTELFITSKLWNDSHAPADVEPALRATLNDLRLDYIDLYLIHWPVAVRKGAISDLNDSDFISLKILPISDTWKEMERLAGLGLAKSIGVSNFSIEKIEEMKNYASIMPAVDQVESHPFLQQDDLIEYAHNNGIAITAYAPLASRDRPDNLKSFNEPQLLEHPVILAVADKHHATPAQILIAWQIQRDIIVIPKSTSEQRLKENYDAQNIHLDSNDMLEINKLNKDYRYVTAKPFVSKKNGYTEESIWS